MGSINSKLKGKQFEREIARLLTKKTATPWHRTPYSGMMSTVQGDQSLSGDVYTKHPDWQDIHVECKSYKTLTINEFFSNKSKIWKWVKQATKDGKGQPWMLFIKINNLGTYCMTEKPELLHAMNIPLFKIIEFKAGSIVMVKIEREQLNE